MLDRRQFGVAMTGLGATVATHAAARPATPPWDREGVVARGGGMIHWATLGEGPPVVLMPKLGGWIADWRHVAPLLAKRRRVIAIDPPGHGGSRMATPAPYVQTLPESAAMVRATLQELEIERYAIVGNSLGGCIGLVMAALWPGDVTRLVALSAALNPGVTRAEARRRDAEVPPDTYDAQWRPLPRPFAEMNAKFGLTRAIHDEMNASRAAAGAWVRASERGVMLADLPAYLPRIAAPTLLVYGSTGPYPQHRATGLRLIPGARAETMDGGSFLHQQSPVETARVLTDFLSA